MLWKIIQPGDRTSLLCIHDFDDVSSIAAYLSVCLHRTPPPPPMILGAGIRWRWRFFVCTLRDWKMYFQSLMGLRGKNPIEIFLTCLKDLFCHLCSQVKPGFTVHIFSMPRSFDIWEKTKIWSHSRTAYALKQCFSSSMEASHHYPKMSPQEEFSKVESTVVHVTALFFLNLMLI